MPNVKVLTKLRQNCVFRFISFHAYGGLDDSRNLCSDDTGFYKSLEFLNCLQMPIRLTESSEVLTLEDFIRIWLHRKSHCLHTAAAFLVQSFAFIKASFSFTLPNCPCSVITIRDYLRNLPRFLFHPTPQVYVWNSHV